MWRTVGTVRGTERDRRRIVELHIQQCGMGAVEQCRAGTLEDAELARQTARKSDPQIPNPRLDPFHVVQAGAAPARELPGMER